MSGFLYPPTFTPPQYSIPWATIGDVLTVTASGLQFKPASGGGGGGIGTYLLAAPAGGSYADYDPAGFGSGVGRLDIDTTAGNVTIESLTAGADAQLLIITNIGANLLQLNAPGFRLPADLVLPKYDAQLVCYYAGSINLWCMA